MNSVTSNAVAASINAVQSLIRGEYSQEFKVLVSGYFNNSNWCSGVMYEGGYHSYLVIAQRLATHDTYFAIVQAYGEEAHKSYEIRELVNDDFSVDYNQLGTFEVRYNDVPNRWNYTIFVAQLA